MEDLNKQQLILLVLLVTFVTSIATGIITVSLLDKAPVEVTQTINKVVERTVETVVPSDIQPKEKIVTVKETVVVTEEDRVIDAVSKNKDSIVRITQGTNPVVFNGVGVLLGESGRVLTDVSGLIQDIEYTVTLSSGKVLTAKVTDLLAESGLAYLQINIPEEGIGSTFATISGESLKLGQSVIKIEGRERNVIATGLVSDLILDDGVITGISTNMNLTDIANGSVLFNLSGDVVGIYVFSRQMFVPVQASQNATGSTSNTASVGEAF